MTERAHRVGEKLNHASSHHVDSNSNPSGSYGKQHRPIIIYQQHEKKASEKT